MNQLDRIEAKLTRLLEIAETLLASDDGKATRILGAEMAEAFNGMEGEASREQLLTDETESVLINAEQSLQGLFQKYPAFKEDFFKLDPELAGLKGPMAMEMLKEATLGMIAKSLRMGVEEFVNRVSAVLQRY